MRVRILRTTKTPADERALAKLLREAELPIEEEVSDYQEDISIQEEAFLDDLVDDEEPATDEEPDNGEVYAADDVYVIVLTPDCVEDEDTNSVIRRAATGGGQVIGIWPEGVSGGKVPAILDRLGASLVQWNAEVLKNTIVRGVPTWREPTGEYRAEPKTKRNKC